MSPPPGSAKVVKMKVAKIAQDSSGKTNETTNGKGGLTNPVARLVLNPSQI